MSGELEPLQSWRMVVPKDWIDYNGHLNEGYYAVAFGLASDHLLSHLGLNESYLADVGTFYTVDTRISYHTEIQEGSEISTRTILLAADEKRLHVLHQLMVTGLDRTAATQESMMLHVRRPGPTVAPMEQPLLGAAAALAEHHRGLDRPTGLGAGVRQLRGSSGG